ncbi:hypothetical protein F5884DRAFT_345146 [Xylogone sp. PMI_703]|nr:hypothetical protein F5884DRAFT_345146 [Xylogone sp. PMI_703]
MHPEAMLYTSRQTQGKLQDRHLSVAASLCGVVLHEHFYEKFHMPGTYGRLTARERLIQKLHNEQLRTVVLSLRISAKKPRSLKRVSQSISMTMANLSSREKMDVVDIPAHSQETSSQFSKETVLEETPYIRTSQTSDRPVGQREINLDNYGNFEVPSTSTAHISPSVKNEFRTIALQGLKYMASWLALSGMNADNAMRLCVEGATGELDLFETQVWDNIPLPLRSWLQAQDGLKIDSVPITDINGIHVAYTLLSRSPESSEEIRDAGPSESIIKLAVRYYYCYYQNRECSSKFKDLIIAGTGARKTMPRKCSKCGSRLLDDALARYKKLDPTHYVTRTQFSRGTCGNTACIPSNTAVYAIPSTNSFWVPADSRRLRCPPRKAEWTSILLRNENFDGLPATVKLRCRKCNQEMYEDMSPRWTIEKSPRYLMRTPRCPQCSSHTSRNIGSTKWAPIDKAIISIDAALLSKVWKRLQLLPVNLEDLKQNPEHYFPSRSS